jgi:2-aminoadipate transaminase
MQDPMTITTDSARWLSQRARRTSEPQISVMLSKVLGDPSIISLAAGFVDQKSLPAEMVREVLEHSVFATGDIARKALQYGSTNGLAELREALVPRLEAGGVAGPVDPNHIVLTSGSQQLLYLITDVLVDPGDIVLVEDPTYFVYMGVLEGAGARTLGVATDDDGMIPQALEERLEEVRAAGELRRVKLLYLMTYFQNPKGTSHSWRRREQLYEIIERYSTADNFIHILEDAAYFELKFEGEDVPFMKKLDPKNERVLLALTFSKAFAPGMRLGYGHLPARVVEPVLNQKGNHDFGSSNFAQHIVNFALRNGLFDKHGARLRDRYRAKRDLMLKVIREEFPPEVRFVEPKGGLYVWATLPESVATSPGSAFFDEAMARKVLYVPGCYCYACEQGRPKPDNQLRLCYGYIEEEPMVEGLQRLAGAMKACV